MYAPNTDVPDFFLDLFANIKSFEHEALLLAGDFNTVISGKDKKGGATKIGHPKSADVIKDFMLSDNVVDIWRLRHPDSNRYTWFKAKPTVIMERLDYFLVSTSLTSMILYTDISPSFASDHSIPHILLSFGEEDRGNGYWKMNTKLLTCEEYQNKVKKVISEHSEKITDITLRWEMIKMSVRGTSFQTSVQKKKSDRNKLEALYNKQYQTQVKLESGDLSLFTNHAQQLNLINKDIEEIVQKQVRAATLLNQVNWYSQGEKSSAYFFGLEKARYKVPLTQLQIKDTIIKDQDVILEYIKDYYTDLFSPHRVDEIEGYLQNTPVNKIAEDDKLILEQPITLEEIEIAIRQLAVGKCPGLDGIPQEFYLTFLQDIKYNLHSLFKRWVEEGQMSSSSREGVLSLLDKPGRDQIKDF